MISYFIVFDSKSLYQQANKVLHYIYRSRIKLGVVGFQDVRINSRHLKKIPKESCQLFMASPHPGGHFWHDGLDRCQRHLHPASHYFNPGSGETETFDLRCSGYPVGKCGPPTLHLSGPIQECDKRKNCHRIYDIVRFGAQRYFGLHLQLATSLFRSQTQCWSDWSYIFCGLHHLHESHFLPALHSELR